MKVNDKKLGEYLKKIVPPTCPLCKNNKWTVSDNIFQLMEFNGNEIVIGGQLYPVLPVLCENCGNTYFINVLVAGLIEPSQSKKKENDEVK